MKSASLGAIGALILGGMALGLVGFNQHGAPAEQIAVPAASSGVTNAPVSSSIDWRADAWSDFSAGTEDYAEAAIGFNATYKGTFSSDPHWGRDYQVIESSRHPGNFHVFKIVNPIKPAEPQGA